MKFVFSTFNHCDMGKRGLEDLIGIMSHQMRALGHEAVCGNEFIPSYAGYNVLIESFADPIFLSMISSAHFCGCRFIYVATEEPTMKGFNHGVAPGMIERQDAFAAAARFADGILHLVPGGDVTRWYSMFKPAAYAELGYAPTLVYDGPVVEPEFDFGFYGQITFRRREILSRLPGSVHVVPNIEVSAAERDAEMRRVRVVVQIREHDDMGFVSSSRCCSALNLGRPVVAEPHPVCKMWDQVILFSYSLESFYNDAAVAATCWRARHRDQLARFKEHFSPEVCIGNPLREIGIT